jgi:hypothetical protein
MISNNSLGRFLPSDFLMLKKLIISAANQEEVLAQG